MNSVGKLGFLLLAQKYQVHQQLRGKAASSDGGSDTWDLHMVYFTDSVEEIHHTNKLSQARI